MTRKRILSLLLIFVMVLSLLPNGTVAMAADGTEGTATQQQGTANENTLPENTDGTEGGEGSVELTEKPTPVGTLVVPATPMSIPNESKANTKQSGDPMETVYTVEFTYGTLTYVLPGGSEVKLSDVLSYVGLSGEVTAASGSNDELFSVSNESGEWVIRFHQPFSTEEKLSVTINGIAYEIIVTDAKVYQMSSIRALATDIYGAQLASNPNTYYFLDIKSSNPVGWFGYDIPNSSQYTVSSSNLYVDESCANPLVRTPSPDGVYYVKFYVKNTKANNHDLDFSWFENPENLSGCVLLLTGYETECVDIKVTTKSNYDTAEFKFKISPAIIRSLMGCHVSAHGFKYYNHISGDSWDLHLVEYLGDSLLWKNNLNPPAGWYYIASGTLYSDEECKTEVTYKPTEGHVYYYKVTVENKKLNDSTLIFSELKESDCSLFIPSCSTEVISLKNENKNEGENWRNTIEIKFKINFETMKFSTQPQGGAILSGERHNVTWATNFTPVSLHRFKDGVTDKVFSDPTITSENIFEAGVFKYRAWYGTGDDEYVDSDEFKVTKIYRVTLDPNGGTVSPTSMETNADGRLESLPTPTRDQYNFKAWYDAGAGVTVDADHVYAVSTTLVALWERKTYTVTFNADGGEVTPKSMTTGKDGKLSSLPTPTLEGRDFLYWTDATTGKQVGLDRVYTGNATLIAKWEKKTYAVSFDTKGGTAIDSQSVKYREKAERPAGVPKKDGWLFVDWYKDEACTTKFNFNSPITKNTTVYAKWVEGYFVDFYAEGGTPGFISVDVLKGHAVSRPVDPVKELSVFGGWYENLNNYEAFDFDTPITSHVALHAKWLPQVVYDAGGHGENVTRTLNPGELAEELRPRDEGYRFVGWYLDADGSVLFDFTKPVYEGVTLYAAWASEIEGVSLGFEELKVGSYFGLDNNNYARLVLGKKDSEHYALPSKTVSWQKDGTEETMNNSQVVEGHPYAASFTLRANPGYVFPELATDAQKAAFLSMEGEFAGLVVTYPENGAMTGDAYLDLELNEDEDPRLAHTELTVTVTYVPRVLTINRVSFGFREPLAGQAFNPNGYNAIECAVDENAPFGVTVYQGGWKPEGGQNGETTFVKGNTYVGTLLLTAKPGFQFRRTSGNQDWEQYVQITRIYGGQILPCGAWAVNPVRFEVVRQWTEYGNSNVILEIYYVVEQRDLEMIISVTHDDDAYEVIYAVDDEGTYWKAADKLCNDQDYVNAFESDRSSIQCKWYADGKLYATTTYNAGQGKRHEVRFGPEDAGKSLYVVMTYGQKSLTSETMTIDELDVRTVKFVLNERCTGSAPETRYVRTGEKVTRPVDPQAAAGWKFAGWAPNATQGGLYDFDAAVTENLTLYARVAKLVSVTFQANGGSGSMEAVTAGQGETLELPACGFTAPEGCEFDCWRIGSVNYPAGARITISEDRYVKAVWKEAQASPHDENLKIAKKSLTLYDTIAIEFKVEKAAVDASYRDPYLEVTQNGVGSKLSDYAISADGKHYVFTVRIAPHQLGDAVTAVPHALNANGEDVTGAEFTYSVAEYCCNMLNKEAYQGAEYAKLRRLLVDILLYGDAAQAYANHKTEALAGSNLTDAQRAMGTDVSVPMNYRSVKEPSYEAAEAGNALASIERAALYLEAAVNVQFKFTANDLSNLRVVITDNEACTNVMEEYEASEGLIDGNGLHYVNVSCLNAGQMRKTIYATVMKGSRKVSNTYRYSIESYAAAMKGKGGDKLDNLLDAMMRYGDSAAAYVNNQ